MRGRVIDNPATVRLLYGLATRQGRHGAVPELSPARIRRCLVRRNLSPSFPPKGGLCVIGEPDQ